MLWGFTTTIVLCALTLYIMSEVHGVTDPQENSECADLSNTTWQQYRQHRAKLQVRYLLLTRDNVECAKVFSQETLSKAQQPFNFNTSRTSKVVVHGYRAMGSKPSWVMELAQVLLKAEDANVLIVDWVYGASFAYNLVVESYKEVAVQISVLINQLQKQGSKLESFHFIGVSLGAHVAGFVGTLFEGKIGRITALDPAGPMFKRADTFDRLDPSDAKFVDAIHTDSDYFGISIPVGHVDFFLNGGNDQTGCARSRFASMYGYVICDHMRALHVYMSALNSSCALTGLPCTSYEDFLKGQCVDCNVFKGTCPTIGMYKLFQKGPLWLLVFIPTKQEHTALLPFHQVSPPADLMKWVKYCLSENSGITVSPIPKEQKVFLTTTSSAPFCTHHILVELEVSPLDKSAELELTLIKESQKVEKRLRLQTDTTVYRTVLAHQAPLCEIDSITVRNTGARFYRQADIHVRSVCLSQLPRREAPLCVNKFDVRRGAPWSHDFVQVCN